MTPPTIDRIDLSAGGGVGSVSVLVWGATAPGAGAVVVLAHGAGSRADHRVHVGVCEAIAARGHVVVAFNFPYAEAGRRSPDRTERLLSCFTDVAAWVAQQFPQRRVVAGGRSMGGRMASLLQASARPFSGLVLLNYPLIASRQTATSTPRTAHWPDLDVPILFVHGTRDRLFPPEVYEASKHLLTAPVTMHVIDDADHVFAVPRRTGRSADDVYAEVAGAVDAWLASAAVAA